MVAAGNKAKFLSLVNHSKKQQIITNQNHKKQTEQQMAELSGKK